MYLPQCSKQTYMILYMYKKDITFNETEANLFRLCLGVCAI